MQGSLKPALLKVVKEGGEGVATIVYTTFQFQADDVANYLYTHGLSAASYHAGKFDKVLFACTCIPRPGHVLYCEGKPACKTANG